MTDVVLDTHTLYWWEVDPDRLSSAARDVLQAADELVVAPVTWWELAWLIRRGRLRVRAPARSWIADLAAGVRTAALTPAVAATAAELPDTFPKDPFDRVIYATAVEAGLRLATVDRAIRAYDEGRVVVW
jgi:PIN domain nuclease of toxin-antitoxin system